MNRALAPLAVVISIVAVALVARTQPFTNISLDGRMMRMLIAGTGSTTVVFESGLGPPLEIWGKVQPDVSGFARTVAYDRAGVGLSDEGPRPRDGRQIASELHRALALAELPPPYVLVGHSFGGPLVRIFTDMYPDAVSGMVLVDPTPDSEQIGGGERPEAAAWTDTLNQSRGSHIPSGIPVVLIRAARPAAVPFATPAVYRDRLERRGVIEAESRELQAWIAGIPSGRLITTNQSGHNVPVEQPALVVDTIRQVVSLLEESPRGKDR